MSWAVQALGDTLLVHSDPSKPAGVPKPTDEALAGKKFVILYFSASWCPPCKKFTSFFSVLYEDMIEGADRNEVEVRWARPAPFFPAPRALPLSLPPYSPPFPRLSSCPTTTQCLTLMSTFPACSGRPFPLRQRTSAMA